MTAERKPPLEKEESIRITFTPKQQEQLLKNLEARQAAKAAAAKAAVLAERERKRKDYLKSRRALVTEAKLQELLPRAQDVLNAKWRYSRKKPPTLTTSYIRIFHLPSDKRTWRSNQYIALRKVLRQGDRYIMVEYNAPDYISKSKVHGFSFRYHYYLIINLRTLKTITFSRRE